MKINTARLCFPPAFAYRLPALASAHQIKKPTRAGYFLASLQRHFHAASFA
jgi:hypothetical protein